MTDDLRRLVLVHAHPDDETIGNGATMAKYAAEGVEVTLVTCTRGEQGEVIPAELAHLAHPDRLGEYRVGELASAMTALGVRDHRFLGDPSVPGRPAEEVRAGGGVVYADSGMAYDHDGGVVPSPNPPAGAFALVDVEEPAERLAALLRELRPQVVVGYEPGGGYGHPDHVQAHLVMMRGVELAALAGPDDEAPWVVPKVYWTVMPETLTREALRTLRDGMGEDYTGPDPEDRLPSMVVPDDQVTAAIDATAFTAAKVEALRAHVTQVKVSPNGTYFALSNDVSQPVMGLEFYRLVRGTAGGTRDELGRETDLFA
ncbi:1D-myo-inositol 2-acetamido-2-deoxy-alpha-D-glucopyranoside deacetylase [Kineosporia sp. NBRC 101677]|uniref:N-acetyl-1-D-myo-inositol-2-amino-2-deoxy-alpha- D-glucopyranoside deacetylase n=1 Tax=Kineosporia sp. NBRC 101677 TaxID=3032197 RepID=UPI0024A10B2C|nr:N-acetyl-1-D-myo-inositol-2-amino-2-deoxy-alpha-D-glucopyranoside deacetylase [Kineosporia sp. NBRC 101677]GLY14744.1 1D-myo-inositol 2-acetamido-2-deoxy-alpha-D-glucopyranoside deacetylase [Kineosporia sp. NBRC 101677]